MAAKSKFNWYRPQTLHQLACSPNKPEQMALAYIRWLAKRDGITIPPSSRQTLNFTGNVARQSGRSGMNGTSKGWCSSVSFYSFCSIRELAAEIAVPHSSYNPAARELTA